MLLPSGNGVLPNFFLPCHIPLVPFTLLRSPPFPLFRHPIVCNPPTLPAALTLILPSPNAIASNHVSFGLRGHHGQALNFPTEHEC